MLVKSGFHRTSEVVCSCPLPAPLQTERKSTASDLCSSNRTNRGAIRPHRNRNEPGVRKDVINHKTFSSLSSGLNTPLFCIPCIEAGYAKNSRCFHRSPRLSNRSPKLQAKDRSKPPPLQSLASSQSFKTIT